MDLNSLKGHIARNMTRDEANPLKTYVDPITREADIRTWVTLAKESGDSSDYALALAALIAEQSKEVPADAVATWHANQALIERFPSAEAVAHWGLGRAYDNLDEPLKAFSHYGAGGRLFRDLGVAEGDDLSGFATASKDGRDIQLRDKAARKYAVELGVNQGINDWLRGRSEVDTSKIGARFGAFVTNDLMFVNGANERLRSLLWQLQEPLSKPENYLLEASPGSGKSFFVREFANQVRTHLKRDAVYLEKNLSAYPSIESAFTDIVLDVILSLAQHRDVVLFIDEVDTEIDSRRIFQKLIAPMNGDKFFFEEKEVSFARQNIVVFYALSGHRDVLEQAPKWPDFLSRIPNEHWFVLPAFDTPFERLFRAIGILRRGRLKVQKVSVHALLYLSLRDWSSSREMDQALELAKVRLRDPNNVLDLEHVARSLDDVREVVASSNVWFAQEVNNAVTIGA